MHYDLSCAGKVWLAPMAGYTDVSFRAIARSFGWRGLCFTEMLNPKSILMFFKRTPKKNNRLKALLDSSEMDPPIAYQLYGNDPQEILDAALILREKYKAKWIDINMGCPQRKIANKGSGAGLLLNHKLAIAIISTLKEKTDLIISAKLRIGWNDNDKNGLELAKALAQVGIDAITIHARTRSQGYSGKANWNAIKEAVDSLPKLLVVGNGDITSVSSALAMFKETNCGAIMIGRAALKEPWLLRNLELTLLGEKLLIVPSKYERINLFIKHFDDFLRRFGAEKAYLLFRRWIPHYAKSVGLNKDKMLSLIHSTSSEQLREQLLKLHEMNNHSHKNKEPLWC